MTHAIALGGGWEGTRAFPRGFRTPDTRKRLEAALERLQHHHDRFARHSIRAAQALSRIDGLRATMIGQLDLIDGDADLEDGGDAEPSLSFGHGLDQDTAIRSEPIGGARFLDLEEACEDEGAEHDGREPEEVE